MITKNLSDLATESWQSWNPSVASGELELFVVRKGGWEIVIVMLPWEYAECTSRLTLTSNAHFTIRVPIWLQGMALTEMQGLMGKNANDDWRETCCGSWVLSGLNISRAGTLTRCWSAHADGAILTLMTGQAEDDSPCHAILSWHITHHRGEDWPRHNGAPEVTRNIKQMYSQFTVPASGKLWEK